MKAQVESVKRDRTGFKANNEWYGLNKWEAEEGTTIPDFVSQGVEIEFSYKTRGRFKNLETDSIKLVSEASKGNGTYSAQKGGSWSAWGDKDYQKDKDRLIIRQVALKAAVEYWSDSEKRTPEHVTDTADTFVEWITRPVDFAEEQETTGGDEDPFGEQ